jgi:hypothetical protein
MTKEVSGCVGCGLSPCYHCKGLEITCDECGSEIDSYYEIYDVDGEELCEECLKDKFRKH